MPKKRRRKPQDSSSFDPSQLDDPVAMKTEWTGEKKGGANFRTHELVTVNSDRLEIRATKGMKLFCFVFFLGGTAVLIGYPFFVRDMDGFEFIMVAFIVLGMGVTFTVGSGIALYFITIPKVFDKHEGLFWKGRKKPDEVFDQKEIKDLVEFDQIHALQIISEICRGQDSSYYSYELNLVLKEGKRKNVIDHGDVEKIREDAKTLSAFLEKPVWDAIG